MEKTIEKKHLNGNQKKSILDIPHDCIRHNVVPYCQDSRTKISLFLTSKKMFFDQKRNSENFSIINDLKPEYSTIYKTFKQLIISKALESLLKNTTPCEETYHKYHYTVTGNDHKFNKFWNEEDYCTYLKEYWKWETKSISIVDLCKEEIKKNINILNLALEELPKKIKDKKNGIGIIVLAKDLPLIEFDNFSNLEILKIKSGLEVENNEKTEEKNKIYNTVKKYLNAKIKFEYKEDNLSRFKGLKQSMQIEFDDQIIFECGQFVSPCNKITAQRSRLLNKTKNTREYTYWYNGFGFY